MAANGGIARALLRTVVETLDLCAPCKNRIFATDAPTTNGESATDKSRLLEKEDIAAAERASLAQGSTAAAAQVATKDYEVEQDDAALEELSDNADIESVTTDSMKTSTYDFNVQFHQSSTSEATFTRSCFDSVVVNGCTWSSVTFTDCKLSNVVFNNVDLANTHFYNLDLAAVSFRDVELEDVAWMDQFLEQVILTNRSFETRDSRMDEIVVPLLSWNSSTRTRGGYNASDDDDAPSSAMALTRPGLRRISLSAAPRKELLSLPDNCLRLIAANLLLPGAITRIVDWPKAATGTRPADQIRYIVNYKESTYVAWSTYQDSRAFCGDISSAPKTGFHSALLRASRRLYEIGVLLLYRKPLWFPDSYCSVLSFLHDHRKREHKVPKMILPCHGHNYMQLVRIMDILVHERPELDYLGISVSKDFWDVMPWCKRKDATASGNAQWSKCVDDVLNFDWRVDRWSGDTMGNFLLQLARLPLKQAGHALTLQVVFDKIADSPDRASFVKALSERVISLRRNRPQNLARTRHDDCCNQKQFSKCCYARPYEKEVLLKPRSFLILPHSVVERIVHHVLPVDKHWVIEAPSPSTISKSMSESQTRYYRKGSDTSRTTYTSWNLESPSPSRLPHRRGICTAFLRINRECYKIGTRALYSTGLRFGSNPATCLAFLHDHQRKEHTITSVTIYHDETSKCYVWRKLFNALVHNRTDLRLLTVKVSSKFWEAAPWASAAVTAGGIEQSVKSVTRWIGWCCNHGHSCCDQRNFLRHIARLPLKNDKKDMVVKIDIQGSGDDQARKNFLDALKVEIGARRALRPSIAEEQHKVCKAGNLEESCYWEEDKVCERARLTRLMPKKPKKEAPRGL